MVITSAWTSYGSAELALTHVNDKKMNDEQEHSLSPEMQAAINEQARQLADYVDRQLAAALGDCANGAHFTAITHKGGTCACGKLRLGPMCGD